MSCCIDLSKNLNFTSKQTIHWFMCRDLDQSGPAGWYKFKSLVFRVCSYPYQAKLVSQKHAKENKERYPKTVETILKSTYMDDGIDSSPTAEL